MIFKNWVSKFGIKDCWFLGTSILYIYIYIYVDNLFIDRTSLLHNYDIAFRTIANQIVKLLVKRQTFRHYELVHDHNKCRR